MFSATADLEGALTTLTATACGLPRDGGRLTVSRAAELLSSDAGHAGLLALAERLGVAAGELPSRPALARMFDDEMLSMRALKAHRGRNVYSAGKLALWNALWVPFRDQLLPREDAIALLTELVALRTVAGNPDLLRCADVLTTRLTALGFSIERLTREGHAPILVARRAARGLRGRVVLYGHYDAAETPATDWTTDPWILQERDGRFYGCAVGDNKAPLAVRLAAIASMDRTPELIWVLQGEEECGSPFAHAAFPELLRGLQATLFLEENGYHDLDGTQRLLARTLGEGGASLAPDVVLDRVNTALSRDASDWGLKSRVEVRGLNKDFFGGGCPFNRHLPPGSRYLAIGVNDPASGIHRPNESVPTWTFALHARQLTTVFREVDRAAGGSL
ncbi:MAG: M20/M25/M40 family metallo-hydrolase [Deltaproteobacteria bacterium]|nr:M20/M25/M40 family metallo-hydrolase [Deltaproteobacteria bacterium]